jgi:AcrR family transcriptional regulator
MERSSLEKPGPGRPRSEEANTAILTAAVALIREVGYDAVAMDAIAARAGVGKATVYRRWKSKEALVADAIQAIVRAVPVPDTGTTAGDVRALLRVALGMYRDPATGPLLSGLVAAMARSERIATVVRNGFGDAWRDAMRRLLRRGIARGELPADADLELAIDLLSAPAFYRYLFTGGPVDERLMQDVVDVVLRGLAPPPVPARRRTPPPATGGREP